MAYEQRELSGAMFKNKRKTTDKHPDYTGTVLINGVTYWMSGWINTPKNNPNGDKYMSVQLSVQEKQNSAADNTASQPSRQKSTFDDFDDDIPF